MIKTRFAPSPTGFLHVGGARTALFAWLHARANGGKFVLRIEDTDKERSKEEYTKAILDSMAWLGLDYDEGPYKQSERLDIYDKHFQVLVEKGLVYPTFDKRDSDGYAPSPNYTEATEAQFKEMTAKGERPAWRFRVPKTGTTEFEDVVHGKMVFDNSTLTDIIIVRSDGMPTYNYACVVDDALMGITHVIRKDDHISNTPAQVCLYKALGFSVPLFAHIPMILGPDNERLSKRHGATSVGQFKDLGYTPEAMINFLGLLSWSIDGKTTIMSRDEMIKHFDVKNVNKSAAVFDFAKLDWMNGIYLREKISDDDFIKLVFKHCQEHGLVAKDATPDDWFKKFAIGIKPKISSIKDLYKEVDFLFT